jgi:hypothetical protein
MVIARATIGLFLLACVVACAGRSTNTLPPPAINQADAEAGSAQEPSNFYATIHAVMAALEADDLVKASDLAHVARREAGGKQPEIATITYMDAMLQAYRGRLEAAIETLTQYLATVDIGSDDFRMEFMFHNALVLLHTAQGDLLAALVEAEEMVDSSQDKTWAKDTDGRTFLLLKKHWHRAYLLRMIAATSTGSRQQAALRYAEQARAEYRALASPLGTYGDSIAVLDAFFAIQDGDAAAALAAAAQVGADVNDDVEDLYLTQIAFDRGGNAERAAAIRERIGQVRSPSFALPVVAMWIERDRVSAAGGPSLWSPRNLKGAASPANPPPTPAPARTSP